MPSQDVSVRKRPEILRGVISASAVLLVDSEIGPAHMNLFWAAVHYFDEAVGFSTAEVVEQFRPSVIAFEKLKAVSGARGKFKPRAITSFVGKDETKRKVFPKNDKGMFGISVRMWRTWKFAGVTAKHVVRNFENRDTTCFEFL